MHWELGKIDGVVVQDLRVHADDRGYLMEVLRSDNPVFTKFGQCYITTTYDSVVKGWHMHAQQTDKLCCIYGMVKVVLCREGIYQVVYMGTQSPKLITIPPGIHHGWKAYNGDATVMNIPDQLYNYEEPDEYRIPPRDGEHSSYLMPDVWDQVDG